MSLIVVVVAMIFDFRGPKRFIDFILSIKSISLVFYLGHLNLLQRNSGLPMILGSFIVTLLSALLATPFAIGAAVFMTEVSPKRSRFLQPAIELLVEFLPVVYGFIGLQVVVPFAA